MDLRIISGCSKGAGRLEGPAETIGDAPFPLVASNPSLSLSTPYFSFVDNEREAAPLRGDAGCAMLKPTPVIFCPGCMTCACIKVFSSTGGDFDGLCSIGALRGGGALC